MEQRFLIKALTRNAFANVRRMGPNLSFWVVTAVMLIIFNRSIFGNRSVCVGYGYYDLIRDEFGV